MKICPICGKEFETNDYRRKYCGNDCYKKSLSIRYHKLYQPKEPETKHCAYCGKEFKTINPKQIYCSHKCQYEVTKQRVASRYLPKRKKDNMI